MKRRNFLGTVIKFFPLIWLLLLYVVLLCRTASTYAGEPSQLVQIWKYALQICVMAGMIGSLAVQDGVAKHITGRPQNFLTDMEERTGAEMAVPYNGLVASAFILASITVLFALYTLTNFRVFLIIVYVLTSLTLLSAAAEIFALYFQGKRDIAAQNLRRFLNPVVLPFAIWMLAMVSTNSAVDFVYAALHAPFNTVQMIIALLIVLCYVLAVAYGCFSIVYCAIALSFSRKDPAHPQQKLDALLEKKAAQEARLEQAVAQIDEEAGDTGFPKKLGLAGRYLGSQIKFYVHERVGAIRYLLLLARLKITAAFHGLLDADRIRVSEIRFCEVMIVLELLALNMFLFVYLGGDHPCARFFETLSTVIIIPIILSSLSNLKKPKRNVP